MTAPTTIKNRVPEKCCRFSATLLFILLLIFITYPLLRLAIATQQFPQPQAILTLGGGPDRETYTAQFALAHPSLPIWVSSGAPPQIARNIFNTAGINADRLTLDYRAVDTVTNFTTLVDDLITDRIHHLYLITSDFHMPRASAIAAIVLGSQGITFTPVPIPTQHQSESFQHITRDILRAYFWIVSDRSGASITLKLKPERRPVFL